mmetsp:Transcript_72058/g.116875  ORF Transcript_72058/g.116875 Transcript_72058/m.116875 type:complete len:281 (+) Transcript_72058:2-844(+)
MLAPQLLASPLAQQIGVALVATSPGLVTSPFHFIATGYGLSVAALAIHALQGALARGQVSPAVWAQGGLMAMFGMRLATFLHFRTQAESYKARPEMQEVKQRMAAVSLAKKVPMWVGVSAMYAAMCSPLQYAALSVQEQSTPLSLAATVVGLSAMAAGLVLEAGADSQKTAFKAQHPTRFCTTGFYSFCRHPNYAGEILFWAGNFLAALPTLTKSPSRWMWSGTGLLLIIQVMVGAVKRLAVQQETKYAENKSTATQWKLYTSSTPGLLIPGVAWPQKKK